MEYNAVFEIDGGVSHGFGLKEPDHYWRTEKIIANSNEDAMKQTIERVMYHANESLSNPDTGYTIVTLSSLIDENGRFLDQESLLDLVNEKVDFKDGQITVKHSISDHISYFP